MNSKRIRITNNSGRKVNIINGDEIVPISQGERINVYTKADTLKFCYAEPKRMSLKILEHPGIMREHIKEIAPGFVLFFDCEIKTEDCFDDISVEERNYTHGHVILFGALKTDLECEHKLLWRNQTDKRILRGFLYGSSLFWIANFLLVGLVGISLLFDEFAVGYLVMSLIFLGLFITYIKVFRDEIKFINIEKNSTEMLLECDMITIFTSSKHRIAFKSIEYLKGEDYDEYRA